MRRVGVHFLLGFASSQTACGIAVGIPGNGNGVDARRDIRDVTCKTCLALADVDGGTE